MFVMGTFLDSGDLDEAWQALNWLRAVERYSDTSVDHRLLPCIGSLTIDYKTMCREHIQWMRLEATL